MYPKLPHVERRLVLDAENGPAAIDHRRMERLRAPPASALARPPRRRAQRRHHTHLVLWCRQVFALWVRT
jgi:hypothetical protein